MMIEREREREREKEKETQDNTAHSHQGCALHAGAYPCRGYCKHQPTLHSKQIR